MIEVVGAIFIIVIGSIFHFMYDWTHHNKMVGYFTAVNESVWEHLKLVIAPSFLWFIFEAHYYYNNVNLTFAKFVGLLVMLIIIPVIFYTYMKIFKRDIVFFDIGSFVVAVIVGQYVFHLLINMDYSSVLLNHIGVIGLIFIFLRYITHTYVPDKNFIHQDPITKKYGINGHFDSLKK